MSSRQQQQHQIVDSSIEDRDRIQQGYGMIDRKLSLAAVLMSVPRFVYSAIITAIVLLIILNIASSTIRASSFLGPILPPIRAILGTVSTICTIVLIALALFAAWKIYKAISGAFHEEVMNRNERRVAHHETRAAELEVERKQLMVENLRIKNRREEAIAETVEQYPAYLAKALQMGFGAQMDAKATLKIDPGRFYEQLAITQQQGRPGVPALTGPGSGMLPTQVLYEDVRGQVPRGHILVGVGTQGVETKDKAVGALVWIVGLSGTGKTSTTVLRVEERHEDGHRFLGIDPHWFKPDSLTNALAAYADDFLMPMARSTQEQKQVLTAFLREFQGRKGGRIPQPWQKITLLIDETNALADPTTPEEEEIADMLPTIARICGQEARNFNMGGIMVSQQATGLAWLRKVALMIIVHQLLMDSEKKLATNNDTATMEDMKSWPIGRTYVYGVGFQETGPLTVQQPYFKHEVDGGQGWQFDNVPSTPGYSTEEEEEPADRRGGAGRDTEPTPIQRYQERRKATYTDAVEVWNEYYQQNPDARELGRGTLQELLQARGLECSDDLAKTLIKNVKARLQENA